MRLLTIVAALTLTACATKKIEYPANQTNSMMPKAQTSKMVIGKNAWDFEDKDIQVPANFETQGLQYCDVDLDFEQEACPLNKKAIRIYFGENKINSKQPSEAAALTRLNNKALGLMLESQLAGVNRFKIVTNDDDVVNAEKQKQFNEQDIKTIAEQNKNSQVLRPDYAVKIDVVKSADRFYGEHNGLAQYLFEMTTSVIDPYTKEKLAYPNIGKIRIKGTDVRAKESLVYTEVNDRYYTGFDYSDQENVLSVFNAMASKGFDVMLSRLLIEMPASAQVVAFKNNQVTLDRGRNAGILNEETMILFQYQQGFVEPIAVVSVKPSSNSAIAQVVKWKQSDLADEIKEQADGKIYQAPISKRVFAVSVGLPQKYVNTRL